MADQRDTKRRVEVIQENASHVGDAVTIGVAKQGDAVCVLCLGASKGLHPAGNDVLGSVNRCFRAIALDHQHVSIGQDVDGARMLEAGRQGMNLQPFRCGRSFVAPSHGFCDVNRWHQKLLQSG